MKVRFVRVTLLVALVLAPHVHAQTPAAPSSKQEAAERFDRGLQLFEEGNNSAALAEFTRVYELMPNPVVRYNIGLVYAAMSRPVEAVAALESVQNDAALSEERRARAQKTLAEQRLRIGKVAVSSTPAHARVELDGVEVATTPLIDALQVPAGDHVIGVSADGYLPARKQVTVAGSAAVTVHFDLVSSRSKLMANLAIKTRPSEVEVLVGGRSMGKTPLDTSLTLPPGRHSIELRRAGYASVKQLSELGEGATGEIVADLRVDPDAVARDGARLAIASSEPGAVLFVDDERLGAYAAPVRLPIGRHRVRVETSGYLPLEREVVLEPRKELLLEVAPEPTAETRQAHDDRVGFHRLWGWVGIGGGAFVAAGGVGYLMVNASAKDDAQAEYDSATAAVRDETGECDISAGGSSEACNARVADASDELDRVEGRDVIGYVGIGVGAALLTTGAILLITGPDPHRFDRRAAVSLRRPELAAGPGDVGAGLRWRF